jgi:hypothetical protein
MTPPGRRVTITSNPETPLRSVRPASRTREVQRVPTRLDRGRLPSAHIAPAGYAMQRPPIWIARKDVCLILRGPPCQHDFLFPTVPHLDHPPVVRCRGDVQKRPLPCCHDRYVSQTKLFWRNLCRKALGLLRCCPAMPCQAPWLCALRCQTAVPCPTLGPDEMLHFSCFEGKRCGDDGAGFDLTIGAAADPAVKQLGW